MVRKGQKQPANEKPGLNEGRLGNLVEPHEPLALGPLYLGSS